MFYVLGAAPATFRYQAQSASPGASIEAVRLSDGVAVRRWPVAADPTGAGAVRWNGTADGVPVAAGRYGFRVVGADIAQVTAAAGSVGEFTLLDHSFPVQGLHDFGRSPINGFGGGRGHQGQDVFAKCGTPIVAAHAGTVKWVRYQSRAGNYAVIERADGQAYAYMHMKAEALVGEGEKVYTGQPIGAVGDTGRASGCHLHFELWSAPGWREGGEAIDPLPELRRWDEAG